MKKIPALPLFAALAAASMGLSACSGSSTGATPESGEVLTVNVGTMGTYSPYSYQDDNGEYTGYDLEVLKKIEEIDPGVKFQIKAGSWDSLFPALDAGKDQMLANQIISTPEREGKYYRTQVPYFQATSGIIVKEGISGIASLADLKGKTIGLTVGDAHTKLVEDWNAANGDVLTLKYYEEDITTILRDIDAGRVDATINDPAVAASKAELQGIHVVGVGEPLSQEPTYFFFKKTPEGEELRDRLDADLTKLRDSGELSALSVAWFGADYTK